MQDVEVSIGEVLLGLDHESTDVAASFQVEEEFETPLQQLLADITQCCQQEVVGHSGDKEHILHADYQSLKGGRGQCLQAENLILVGKHENLKEFLWA